MIGMRLKFFENSIVAMFSYNKCYSRIDTSSFLVQHEPTTFECLNQSLQYEIALVI